MSNDEFNRMFGRTPDVRPSFTERVTRTEAVGPPPSPSPSVTHDAGRVAPAPDEYRAFGYLPAGNVNLSCEVRWWLAGTAIPEGLAFPYRLLMQVGFTGDDTLRLVLPDTVIEITGQRLEPLRQALMRQQVTFIQQWSSLVWRGKPVQEAAIERIIMER